ncbi:hypothetical protein AAHC03_046 [Spirometra sp. Aus1]
MWGGAEVRKQRECAKVLDRIADRMNDETSMLDGQRTSSYLDKKERTLSWPILDSIARRAGLEVVFAGALSSTE